MENLVIQTAFLGDLALAVPLIRQLAVVDPEHTICVVCRKGLAGVLAAEPTISRIIEVDKKNPQTWAQNKKEIFAREYHHVICPHESMRTALMVRSIRHHGLKIGFKKWWNAWAFDERVTKPLHLPDALRQMSLLMPLSESFVDEMNELIHNGGLENDQTRQEEVDFSSKPIPAWARMGTVRPNKKNWEVFVAPGSVWATKRWSLEGYISLARSLVEKGFHLTIIGSADERNLAEQIKAAVPSVKVSAGEWSIAQTIAHMKEAQILVANDSGAIHLAALAGLPTVAIFGPTTLGLGFRPWQENALVVQKNLDCRPCGRHGHQKCPLGHHNCMKLITPWSVAQAVLKQVARPD